MGWSRISVLPIMMAVVLQGTALAATVQPTVNLKDAHVDELAVKVSSYGGKLLLSDSPETVPADGIMYQDVVKGDTRLFFHHVNGTTQPKKIVVLLENATDEFAHVTVSRYGLGGPSEDYLEVGKKVQRDYVEGGEVYLVEVPSGESRSLISSLDTTVVKPNMLVNGMFDFSTDQPVRVKVMMMPVDADIQAFAATAKVLPPDAGQYRLRGTFEGKDRLVVPQQPYDANLHRVAGITLADNKLDPYVTGIDATDGTHTTNYGNYGIVYKVFMSSMANGKMSCYLNPQGGQYAGWIGAEYRHQDEYAVATPANQTSFGTTTDESAYIGTYEGGKSVWLTFSPPGASNLPIRFVIEPTK